MTRLTHLALHVRDVEACVAFYRDYGAMIEVHARAKQAERIVWLAAPGQAEHFVLVLLPGGPGHDQAPDDFSHLGFALASRAAVDALADRARRAGILAWEPREDAYPAGYYCGISDPDGHVVEFSHGQPLGPGAPRLAPA